MWGFFRRKPQLPQEVTTGRFEIERDGESAYLEYSLSGNILELIHTEVPENLRGAGMASSLAESALLWAKERNLKVDILSRSTADLLPPRDIRLGDSRPRRSAVLDKFVAVPV